MDETCEKPALAESLAEAIKWFVIDQFGMCERSHEIARAILAMPDMRAVQEVLAELLDTTVYGCPYLLQDGSEGHYGPNTCNQGCHDEPECMTCDVIRLPQSVRQWARQWAGPA